MKKGQKRFSILLSGNIEIQQLVRDFTVVLHCAQDDYIDI